MEHHFNVEIAKGYGIESAILLHNFYFWISKNAAEGVNFHDGNYWTFNTTKSLHELFPYIEEQKIKRVIKTLEEENIIISGNYNRNSFDRTKWYAISEKGLDYLSKNGYNTLIITQSSKMNNRLVKNEQSISQNCTMEYSEMNNGMFKNEQPIPYINTDNKQEKEEETSSSSKKKNKFDFKKALVELGVDPIVASEWIEVRKNKKASQTETAFERTRREIEKSGASPNECITMAVEHSWQGFFAKWYFKTKENEGSVGLFSEQQVSKDLVINGQIYR